MVSGIRLPPPRINTTNVAQLNTFVAGYAISATNITWDTKVLQLTSPKDYPYLGIKWKYVDTTGDLPAALVTTAISDLGGDRYFVTSKLMHSGEDVVDVYPNILFGTLVFNYQFTSLSAASTYAAEPGELQLSGTLYGYQLVDA